MKSEKFITEELLLKVISEVNQESSKKKGIDYQNGFLNSAHDYIVEYEHTEDVEQLMRILRINDLLDKILLNHFDKLQLSNSWIKEKAVELNELIMEKIFEYDHVESVFTKASIKKFFASVMSEVKNHSHSEKITNLLKKEKEARANQFVEKLKELGYDVTLTEKKKK